MTRSRQEKRREATVKEIKDTARELMTEFGTAGISIRAIARKMGITSPGVYYYFDNLNTLITALIIDVFEDLAENLTNTANDQQHTTYMARIIALINAYRQWALAHPIDFQLIYGNPIPGYNQPTEVTYPPARRSFALLAGLVAKAIAVGELEPPKEYITLPSELDAPLAALAKLEGHQYSATSLYLAAAIWAQMHGRVMLELFNLIQPVVGNVEAFYQHETINMLKHMGLT